MPDSGTATKISGLVRDRDGGMDGPARIEVSLTSFHCPKEQNGRIPPKSSSEQEYRNRTEQLKGLPHRPAGRIPGQRSLINFQEVGSLVHPIRRPVSS